MKRKDINRQGHFSIPSLPAVAKRLGLVTLATALLLIGHAMNASAWGVTKVAYTSTSSWWTSRADTAMTTTPGPFYLSTHAQAVEYVTPGNWVVDCDRAPAAGFWQKTLLGGVEPADPTESGIGTNANATCYSQAISAPLPLAKAWGLAKAWQTTGTGGAPRYHFSTDAGKFPNNLIFATTTSEADGLAAAFDPVDFEWLAGTHTLLLEYGLEAGTSLRADPGTEYGKVFDVNGEEYTREISMKVHGEIDFLGDVLPDEALYSLTIAHDGNNPINDLVLSPNVTITECSLGSTEGEIEGALRGMWSDEDYAFELDSDFYIRLSYTFTLLEDETASVSYGSESRAGVEAPIPEPGTLCLLAIGGLALLLRRRRA